ncbi:PREDICTED: uncharacterized protein LOC103328275 [Prunus mume]|uniref:Uncharacterized protein LOC103328275 n=1 Tax=Prunus mume TaxID=102107 RepID=A0ABM1LP75_PRUMU|nr:PREDICTED: uncharacterized protein LOC103328275 [Prunus mume]
MVFPPLGVTRSTTLHDEFGKLSTANQGIAAQVAERGHVPGKFWFSQLPSNSCQPQVIGAVQSSTDLSRSVMTGFGQNQTQPIGHKCLICKRDLSFTPEGPVFVPAIRPVVAVLPCGHTFHDHCLRLITPEEEVKNPPCIPCAIGES